MARTMLFGKSMRGRRGFTLVELMIVVAIVGILAALAVYGFRRYQQSPGTSEATALLQSFKGAEEPYADRDKDSTYARLSMTTQAPEVQMEDDTE